eukprot:7884654-Pyramimonas_sp.AAC.1
MDVVLQNCELKTIIDFRDLIRNPPSTGTRRAAAGLCREQPLAPKGGQGSFVDHFRLSLDSRLL